jgi:hypothetical protein
MTTTIQLLKKKTELKKKATKSRFPLRTLILKALGSQWILATMRMSGMKMKNR